MDVLFHKLGVSVRHLSVLHETLRRNNVVYADQCKKIEAAGLDLFADQLYPRGKVGRRLQRQMVLADIFQYILVARGYFVAVKSPADKNRFIRILFDVANLLLLQEELSVDWKLRQKVIASLETKLKNEFYDKREVEFNAAMRDLKRYKGEVLPKKGKEHENAFDSLLPKRNGLAVELIVFAMLLLKNYGYIVPLLLSQRLLRGGSDASVPKVDFVAPPDFLLLRDKGEVFGIEVGGGKDAQNTKFSASTSIPLFAVRLGHRRMPQPYRCGYCGRWITYSDYVVDGLIRGDLSPEQQSVPAKELLDQGEINASDVVFFEEAIDRYGNRKKLRYHLNCVRAQKIVKQRLAKNSKPLLLVVPHVQGMEILRDVPTSAKSTVTTNDDGDTENGD